MPVPAAFGALSLVAAKQIAVQAAAAVSSYDVGVASAALTAFGLARLAWNRIPDWIKNDESFQHLMGENKRRLDDDLADATNMASLASVLDKLQLLLQSGIERLQALQSHPVPYLHATLLVYIQLAAQLKELYPDRRCGWYRSSGSIDNDAFFAVNQEDLRMAFDWSLLAYENDFESLHHSLGDEFKVLQHDALPPRPGLVGHYLAVSEVQKLVVVGIKGTSSLEDLLTDCCGRAVPYRSNFCSGHTVEVSAEAPDSIDASDKEVEVLSGHERIWVHSSDDERVRCHEGILVSAVRLANTIEALIEQYVIRGQYRCILCGHSLGAGAAALLALVLRERFPALAETPGILQVYAFAPPPVLDHDSAMVASSYVLSVVNKSDIIPRSSLANFVVFREFLRFVSQRMAERGLAPTGPASTAALIRKLARGTEDADLLMTIDDVEQARAAAYAKVHVRDPDHLYVPGRVMVLYEHSKGSAAHSSDPSECNNVEFSDHGCIFTVGDSEILRFFDFDGLSILLDHCSASYASSLDSLCLS